METIATLSLVEPCSPLPEAFSSPSSIIQLLVSFNMHHVLTLEDRRALHLVNKETRDCVDQHSLLGYKLKFEDYHRGYGHFRGFLDNVVKLYCGTTMSRGFINSDTLPLLRTLNLPRVKSLCVHFINVNFLPSLVDIPWTTLEEVYIWVSLGLRIASFEDDFFLPWHWNKVKKIKYTVLVINHPSQVPMAVALAEQTDRRLPRLDELKILTDYPQAVRSELQKHRFRCPNVIVERSDYTDARWGEVEV